MAASKAWTLLRGVNWLAGEPWLVVEGVDVLDGRCGRVGVEGEDISNKAMDLGEDY